MSEAVDVKIDPEFHGLCPPLSDGEYHQLEANLLADGCRDPLVLWEEAAILLDGHNRYDICREHALPFVIRSISLAGREEAINWIINTQLGRRNLTEEQKSYLRGKRYNREKKQGERTDLTSADNQQKLTTAQSLATEYHVATSTIRADGDFADAVDTLDAHVRADMREAVLKRPAPRQQRGTKKQVTEAGKLIRTQTVKPLPFMQRDSWKHYHVLEAIELLGTLPFPEHEAIDRWLDHPHMPATDGLTILKHLRAHTPEQRQYLYQLRASTDLREQSLATTMATQKRPEPDKQSLMAQALIREVDTIRHRQRTQWRRLCPQEPWACDLDEIDTALATVQRRWRDIATQIDQRHAERIAHHAEIFQPQSRHC